MPRIIKMAKGAYTASSITVDGEGRVVTASSGAAGAQPMNLLLTAEGPAASNVATSNNTSQVLAYIGGGGGGAGGQNSSNPAAWQQSGGSGGAGGWGFHTAPVAGGTTLAYNVGAGGAAGNYASTGLTGSTGGATTLTNVGTGNGGIGGNGARTAGVQGNTGSAGTSPGGTAIVAGALYDQALIIGGAQKVTNVPATAPVAGNAGCLMVYEM